MLHLPKMLFYGSCKIMSLPLSIQNEQLAIINAKVPIHPITLRARSFCIANFALLILHCFSLHRLDFSYFVGLTLNYSCSRFSHAICGFHYLACGLPHFFRGTPPVACGCPHRSRGHPDAVRGCPHLACGFPHVACSPRHLACSPRRAAWGRRYIINKLFCIVNFDIQSHCIIGLINLRDASRNTWICIEAMVVRGYAQDIFSRLIKIIPDANRNYFARGN